jgi:heme oxygenase
MCEPDTVCASARSLARKLVKAAQRARTALARFAVMLQATVATRTPSLMGRLRDATAGVRDHRELLTGRVTWLDYRMYLFKMYGFYAAVERALTASRQLATVVPDAGLRNHKAALLAADLVALGVERRDLLRLPRMAFAGQLALPEAVGWTYVLESLTVGGKPLARRLARQLPREIQTASAYLGCYGDEAAERWREVGDALDGWAQTDRDIDRVVEAARDGFGQLRSWVSPAVQPRSTRIHA